MKFLVVISACLAVSSGSILPHHGLAGGYGGYYPGYAGPLADVAPASFHGLVGHPNGAVTPVDTPSVQAARADHLAAKGAIYAAHAPALVAAPAVPALAAGPAFGGVPALAAAPALGPVAAIGYAGYAGPLADALPAGAAGLVAHPNGAVTPADTPSVVAARADHLAARGAAYAAAAPVLAYGAGYGVPAVAGPAFAGPAIAGPALGPVAAIGYAGYAGPLADALPAGAAGLVAHPNGAVTPADTPSVVAARADHLAARGAAYAAAAPVLAYGPGPAIAGPAFAAPAIAAPAVPFVGHAVGPVPAHAYAGGVIPTGPYGSPTGALVSFPNGAVVPADEPAVVAARADHLAAKGGLGW